MKRLFILLIAGVMLASCSVYTATSRKVYSTFVDFRPFIEDGFQIYTSDCYVKHSQLGELAMFVIPEFKEIHYYETDEYDAIIYDFDATYGYEFINTNELLLEAVNKAKELGANGISHLKIEKSYVGVQNAPQYSITGICIRIE